MNVSESFSLLTSAGGSCPHQTKYAGYNQLGKTGFTGLTEMAMNSGIQGFRD
jgi:hypothetical protein